MNAQLKEAEGGLPALPSVWPGMFTGPRAQGQKQNSGN
jgi:hypothetical protein